MPIDPFSLKGKSYCNPNRLFVTLTFRLHELLARARFTADALPLVQVPTSVQPASDWQASRDTAVTHKQATVLKECLRMTERLHEPCVEIGSFRGQTTRFLAQNTARTVIAVDPFIGWGGWEADYQEFVKRTAGLPNVSHLRLTSGQAGVKIPAASFVLIDAVHDYANVRFDLSVYAPKVVPAGVIALHDTDNSAFAGVRRAIRQFTRGNPQYALLFHVHDLVVLQNR